MQVLPLYTFQLPLSSVNNSKWGVAWIKYSFDTPDNLLTYRPSPTVPVLFPASSPHGSRFTSSLFIVY